MLTLLIVLGDSACRLSASEVTLNPNQTYQTIEGWGHSGGNLGGFIQVNYLDPSIMDAVNKSRIDVLVDDLGLTGSRLVELGSRSDGSANDAGDCDQIDWSRFHVTDREKIVGRYLAYFKDRVVGEGFTPDFYTSTGYANYSNHYKPWVLHDPGERAQQLWANLLYWKQEFGIDIPYTVIINEPGSPSFYTPAIIADVIRALGPRLAVKGLKTRVQYAEGVSPERTWQFITAIKDDEEVWRYIGRLSYHKYGKSAPYLTQIRDFAATRRIPTAQTEMDRATLNDLYEDLTEGGVSYWELSYSSSEILDPDPGLTSFVPSPWYFPIRAVTHYVRPGAIRISASSNDATLKALAFTDHGSTTVVLYNNSGGPGQDVQIVGLPAGRYGMAVVQLAADHLTSKPSFDEAGIRDIDADPQSWRIPANCIATIYPSTRGREHPTIMTLRSQPGYLQLPEQGVHLTVTASDPGREDLQYHWSVISAPNGAHAELMSPHAASTAVQGLSVSGPYGFSVTVANAETSVTRVLYVMVRSQPQAPIVTEIGFRFGPPYGMVSDDPDSAEKVEAHIASPASDATLSANIIDPGQLPLTGTWSVVEHPPGAQVIIGKTIYVYVSFRAKVSGMTVPGRYEFQLVCGDTVHQVTSSIVCMVDTASVGPVISSVASLPSDVDVSTGMADLSVTAIAGPGVIVRCWWEISQAPAGSHPVFTHQGGFATKIDHLTVPGVYTFTAHVFDDVHEAFRKIQVTVR